jgi:flagellar protein FliS
MQTTPYQRYQQTQAQTASPTQLVVMLYEGLVRFCSAADAAMRARDIEGAHENLVKAQAIVAELAGSLNYQQGGDIATNLGRLYDYCHRRLVEANVRKDTSIVVEVRTLMSDMLSTWREIARQEQATTSGPRLAGVTG